MHTSHTTVYIHVHVHSVCIHTYIPLCTVHNYVVLTTLDCGIGADVQCTYMYSALESMITGCTVSPLYTYTCGVAALECGIGAVHILAG